MAEGPGAPAKKVLRHVTFSCLSVALAYFKEKTHKPGEEAGKTQAKRNPLASFSLLTTVFSFIFCIMHFMTLVLMSTLGVAFKPEPEANRHHTRRVMRRQTEEGV